MKTILQSASLLALLTLTGCAHRESVEARLAGCYAIEAGAFSPAEAVQLSHKVPQMVNLDTTAKEFLYSGKRDHRTIADIVGGGDFFVSRDAGWIVTDDTLRLKWSSAFTGAEISVPAGGERMKGRIEFFSDQIGMRMPAAPVTMIRTPC